MEVTHSTLDEIKKCIHDNKEGFNQLWVYRNTVFQGTILLKLMALDIIISNAKLVIVLRKTIDNRVVTVNVTIEKEDLQEYVFIYE